MKNSRIAQVVSIILLCLFTSNYIYAQCKATSYSTNPNDSWLSCQTSANPNTDRGNSHWVQYDLGYIYELGTTHFWNYNVTGITNQGFKQIVIDYSLDGTNWTEAGIFQLPQATGTNSYEGITGLDLSGISARFVLITALSNWDNSSCAGLSQVRFEVSTPANTCGDFIVTQNIDDASIEAGTYYGNSVIEANGTIKDGSMVTFQSATAIHLKAGFTAEAGSQFIAKIESCNLFETPKEQANKSRQSRFPLKNKNTKIDINLYPNPTVNLLNLNFGETVITDLMIINVAGHELLRRKQGQNLQQIDVSALPAGMYLVHMLTSNQELITRRFIKASL